MIHTFPTQQGKIHSQKLPQNKKQENINHAKEEKNLSIKIQMLELADNDIETNIITVFHIAES